MSQGGAIVQRQNRYNMVRLIDKSSTKDFYMYDHYFTRILTFHVVSEESFSSPAETSVDSSFELIHLEVASLDVVNRNRNTNKPALAKPCITLNNSYPPLQVNTS